MSLHSSPEAFLGLSKVPMPKIFVHIGLPKTATTTLQAHFFPSLPIENTLYLGVTQPRRHLQHPAFSRFGDAIRTGRLMEARAELTALLETNELVVISEEMLTVSQPGLPWRKKLDRLAKLLTGLDYTVMVTVREPIAAMYSYYVERHSQFSISKDGFASIARRHEAMEIYHYSALIEVLRRLFNGERVFIKPFEEIVSGELEDLRALLGQGTVQGAFERLGDANRKRKSSSHVYATSRWTIQGRIKQAMTRMGIRWALSETGVLRKEPYRLARMGLQRLFRALPTFERERPVPRPTEAEEADLRAFLEADNQVLFDTFGIDYRNSSALPDVRLA